MGRNLGLGWVKMLTGQVLECGCWGSEDVVYSETSRSMELNGDARDVHTFVPTTIDFVAHGLSSLVVCVSRDGNNALRSLFMVDFFLPGIIYRSFLV